MEEFSLSPAGMEQTFITDLQLGDANAAGFVSVLKWSLLSNGISTTQTLDFTDQDMQVLIRSHVPIFLHANSMFMLPILLQLEGPLGTVFKRVI